MPDMTETPPTRFFVALMLPPEVEAYANETIGELHSQYRTRTAKAAPHITLQAPFLWDPSQIDDLSQAIAAIAAQQSPVPVTLDGFDAFKPRVLYINVEKAPELLALQTSLAQHLQQLDITDPKAKSRSFSPHVTVASRNLSPALFRRIWADLQQRPVHFEFWGDRLTLLIYKDRWHIHSEYSLTG